MHLEKAVFLGSISHVEEIASPELISGSSINLVLKLQASSLLKIKSSKRA
jgi:hypothetical protein